MYHIHIYHKRKEKINKIISGHTIKNSNQNAKHTTNILSTHKKTNTTKMASTNSNA
jgi:hypothetical protein